MLGRTAASLNRDSLTGLLSYPGLQQCHAEIALREAAGQPPASMMLLALPGLERSGAEHGFVVTERTLVRLAATLQSVLGPAWAIGRLSKSRFAAFSLHGMEASDLVASATRILTRCAREIQPPHPVADFDLRIVCRQRLIRGQAFDELVREMEEAAQALDGSRRIALR